MAFSIASCNISRTGLEQAELARPLVYEYSFRYEGTIYEIHRGDTTTYIQAKELTIDVTAGAVRSIVVFHYDGYTLHYNETVEIPQIIRPSITIRMPLSPNHLIENHIFYDYMFLLMVPVEGYPALYMFCVKVDIYNNTIIDIERFNKYNLLELRLNTPISDARRHMLEAYYSLMNHLAELGFL